jgi:hypothetical protein
MYSSSTKKSRSYYSLDMLNNNNYNKTITQLYKRLEDKESTNRLLISVDDIINKTKSNISINPNTIYSDLQIFKNIVKIHEAMENFESFGIFKKNEYIGSVKTIKAKQNIKIKKNIMLYIKKYGTPANGIFDPEKLKELG